MGIGKSSWKEAKEKAKAAGKKIRQKEEGPYPYNTFMSKSFKRAPVKGVNEIKPAGVVKSPVNGNAFTGAMAKTGGDYKAAKAMLGASPANYGAEDFKILQSRRDSAANYKNYGVATSPTMMNLMGRGTNPEKVNENGAATSIGFSSLTKAPKIGENIVEQSSKKIDLVSSSRPQTRQEERLAKTKAKAAEARTKTNQTIKSIDISKPKSADTEAKQISARRSRAKTKRLENRVSRIEGRMERKASRQEQRKKIKGNGSPVKIRPASPKITSIKDRVKQDAARASAPSSPSSGSNGPSQRMKDKIKRDQSPTQMRNKARKK